jgi:probable phosphoglycerate mutase
MCPVPRSYPQTLFRAEPSACQILLIRHGQSAPYSPDRPFDTIDGHGDPHLTELGHHQARLVGDRLAAEAVAAIYTSNLTRTKQTATPLASRLGLSPVVEADLREVLLGEADGGRLRQLMADGDPLTVRIRTERDWGVIPGAESNEALRDRTVAAVTRIADRHRDQLVAVFCHGGVIGSVVGHAAGAHPFAFNGSRHTAISHLVLGPSGWVVRSFNDGAHAGRLTTDHQLPEHHSPDRPA